MFRPDMYLWQGRVDKDEGDDALRWHQLVQPLGRDSAPGIVLVGFCSNEGINRNLGRVGAAGGPRAIRRSLANLAWNRTPPIFDAGDVECADGDLESAQDRLGLVVAAAIAAGHRPIVLGGGHETAWGTFAGLSRVRGDSRLGIINLDAHFDLRPSPPATSGTAFYQMAQWHESQQRPFRYLCLGICEMSNTAALFETARRLGVEWHCDAELDPWNIQPTLDHLDAFIDGSETLYLSVDLDVLQSSVMPAVSAPNPRGIALEAVEMVVKRIAESGKLAAADVVELSPPFDVDSRGARVAAGLAWKIARSWRANADQFPRAVLPETGAADPGGDGGENDELFSL